MDQVTRSTTSTTPPISKEFGHTSTTHTEKLQRDQSELSSTEMTVNLREFNMMFNILK